MSQLNWWLPVYPIASENTMALHPGLWDRPVQNSSSLFNYQAWNKTGRWEASAQGQQDRRVQSEALEPMNLDPQLRLITEPGGVILFSAAHMHSTVPNTTDLTRFSVDFRTVDARDTHQGTGAHNIDSESTGTTAVDYLRASDLAHFADDEIRRDMERTRTPQYPTPQDIVARAALRHP